MVNLCLVCGKQVKRKGSKFCSYTCRAKYRQNTKKCIICKKSFEVPPSSYKVCCSPECSKINRQRLQAEGVYDKNNDVWFAKRDQYALEHQGEKHQNAKWWKLQAPTGEVYEVTNLKAFVRENLDLFDGSNVNQATDGIIKIKASQLGRRKKPCYSYKGWELLDCSD